MKIALIAVAVLVLAGGGAAAYFLLLAPAEEVDPNAAEEVMEEIDESLPPLFHRIPELTASSTVNGRLRYLRVEMQIQTRDEDVLAELQTSTPLIQNALILLLSGYDFSVLESPEGKETFRLRALEEVQGLINAGPVESVLLTGFVVQ